MSITRTVVRPRWFVALVAAVAVLASVVAPGTGARAATFPSRSHALPARAPNDDPAARIASLGALVGQRQRVADAAQARRDQTAADLARAQLAENAALARADMLARAAADAERRYQAARERAGEVAAAVYRNHGNAHALTRLLDSDSPAEYGYHQEIARAAGDVQVKVVQQAIVTRRIAQRLAEEADREKLRYHGLVVSLQGALPDRDRDVARAQSVVARARFWLARWQSIAGGVNTPIMSRSVLSGSEMAAWFEGTHRRARITVPIAELAEDYVEEGDATLVRGDIAFAQSILETGSFYFPDGGQLAPQDNNFAGINACDSCAHGTPFPDARTGVLAQMQLLRVYADPNFSSASLQPAAVLKNLDRHPLKGRVTTWNGLTHTWATADAYGDRILSIYAQMLGWLTDHAQI
jgi:hypothetical protein